MGSCEIPNFECYGTVRALGCVPIESPSTTSQYRSIQSFALSCAVWLVIQCQIMPPPIRSPVWGVKVDVGGRKLSKSKCRPHITIRLLCTLKAYLASFGHTTQCGKQATDRAIRIGRLCYSIGGLLKTRWGTALAEKGAPRTSRKGKA